MAGKGSAILRALFASSTNAAAIHWSKNRGEAIRDLGAKYIADVEAAPDKKRLILAQSNEEVRALNEFARTLHRERGELGEDHALPTAGGNKAFAAGDRVSIAANPRPRPARRRGWSMVRSDRYSISVLRRRASAR